MKKKLLFVIIITVLMLSAAFAIPSFAKTCDLSGDKTTGLDDVIIALQICAGITTSFYHINIEDVDINVDNKIGIEDSIGYLWIIAGKIECPTKDFTETD